MLFGFDEPRERLVSETIELVLDVDADEIAEARVDADELAHSFDRTDRAEHAVDGQDLQQALGVWALEIEGFLSAQQEIFVFDSFGATDALHQLAHLLASAALGELVDARGEP
ncbi:MAG TPA: hypothetical protein VK116_03990 [Planctomycetota bacterium]|nr:hypothetical protein [Planctomycetota bacterium]